MSHRDWVYQTITTETYEMAVLIMWLQRLRRRAIERQRERKRLAQQAYRHRKRVEVREAQRVYMEQLMAEIQARKTRAVGGD